ncbi:MAG: hypothetical protein CMD92_03625 [Gammaproteobacteria bacterium]|nr:hypothetical protein [Gammaproteobacteria bacterium]
MDRYRAASSSELQNVIVKMPKEIVTDAKEHYHQVHIKLAGMRGSLVAAMCSPAGWARHETLVDMSWGDGLVLG